MRNLTAWSIGKLVIILAIMVLSFGSCKTKEKATDCFAETIHTNTSETVMTALHSDLQMENSSSSVSAYTGWSDSIVERFYEHVVTDSSGNVLLCETEHSKDRFTGRTKKNTDIANNIQEMGSEHNVSITQEKKDSLYDAGVLKEVTVVKSKSWRWLWLCGLLAILFITVLIVKKTSK